MNYLQSVQSLNDTQRRLEGHGVSAGLHVDGDRLAEWKAER